MTTVPTIPNPRILRQMLLCWFLFLSLLLHAAPRPGAPALAFPLKDLGYLPIQSRFLVGGETMFTLHFVDDTHLLFTYHSRGLLARLPDATPDDDDRFIAAALVELPTGKVLARTKWRTRDHEQYLWPVAHGRFLLRIRNELALLDPLANPAEPFRQQTFLNFSRRIGYISVSPGGDLLVVETAPPRKAEPDADAEIAAALAAYQAKVAAQAQAAAMRQNSNAPQQPQLPRLTPGLTRRPKADATTKDGSPPIQIHFFRLNTIATAGQPEQLIAQSAGVIGARNLVGVPVTAEGFLDVSQESSNTFLFDFQTHAGKRLELAPYDTTCAPRPYLVSRTEFVAFGCRGSQDKVEFSGFNFRGEQPWIQILSGTQVSTHFATAPAAGRFAFSRVLAASNLYDLDNLTPDALNSQDIMVLQHYDGRTLLKAQASPIQRTGQNFDISPDGLSFAVIHAEQLEVYRLPALSRRDRDNVNLAIASTPEKNVGPILLRSTASPSRAGAVTPPSVSVSTNPPAASTPTADSAGVPEPQADLPPIPTDPVDIINNLVLPGGPPGPRTPPPGQAAVPAATPTPETAAPADPPRKPPTLYDPDHPKPSTPD